MLDFHWIKAMLFFHKYYDFLQFFLHDGIFFPAILSVVEKMGTTWTEKNCDNAIL
jgi:hypothetical protein